MLILKILSKVLTFIILIVTANLFVLVRNLPPKNGRYMDDINNILRHVTGTMIAVAIGILLVR